MRYSFFKRGMSGFLSALIMIYGIGPSRAFAGTVAASDYIQSTDQISDIKPDADEQTTAPEQPETDGAKTASKVYRNGTILISSFAQLEQIGSEQLVKSRDSVPDQIGQGDPVLAEDGAYVTYALDGRYALTGDIAVPAGRMWQLPEGFTGEISPDFYVANQETDTQKQPEPNVPDEDNGAASEETKPEVTEPEETQPGDETQMPEREKTPRLYDPETDTIYLYNPYQLKALASTEGEPQPVTNGDMQAESFGSGEQIYPNATEEPLCYSLSHNYVISAQFRSKLPAAKVSVYQDGKILIRTHQQLEKIASGEELLDSDVNPVLY